MHVTYCGFPESLINIGKNISLVFHITYIRLKKIKINGGQSKLISHTFRPFFFLSNSTAIAFNNIRLSSVFLLSYLFILFFLFCLVHRSPARNHFENNNEDGFNSSIVHRAEAFINVQSSTGF